MEKFDELLGYLHGPNFEVPCIRRVPGNFSRVTTTTSTIETGFSKTLLDPLGGRKGACLTDLKTSASINDTNICKILPPA